MGDLFSQLGIDWKMLVAQIVNFVVLALVLTKFLYKPIIKTLDERKRRASEDLNKTQILADKLKEADVAKESLLAEARKESEKLIKQTEKNASELKASLTKEASIEVEKIKADAKKQIESDKEKTMQELKKELGSLVSLSVEKAFAGEIDKALQDKLVGEALKSTPK